MSGTSVPKILKVKCLPREDSNFKTENLTFYVPKEHDNEIEISADYDIIEETEDDCLEEAAYECFTPEDHTYPIWHVDTSQNSEDVTSQDTGRIIWLESTIKLLLSLYLEMKPKIGTCAKFRTKKNMYIEMKKRLENAGFFYTVEQIEHKLRALERRYKENNTTYTRTGRERKGLIYEKELEESFGNKAEQNVDYTSVKEEKLNPESMMEVVTNPLENISYEESSPNPRETRNKIVKQDTEKKKNIASQLNLIFEETKTYREEMLKAYKDAITKRDRRARKREQLAEERNCILREILKKISN